jgi:hypothetical protein
MNTVPTGNTREATVAKILQTATTAATAGRNLARSSVSYATTVASNTFSGESGNYFLQVLFYLFVYAFVLFLVLVLVHYSIRPVFRFTAGGKGVIGVPGAGGDDQIYWNTRKRPNPEQMAPPADDILSQYPFENNFTLSIDLLVRKLPETGKGNRLILFKAPSSSVPLAGPADGVSLIDHMKTKSNMIMYLSETNDLNVLFFSGSRTGQIQYAAPPVKNIPLYTPFRITVVVEQKLFTVYLNGKQTFQRVTPEPIVFTSNLANQNRFFAAPAWADTPSKSIFVQNLHLWPRQISYDEVIAAQPALALSEDFDAPPEPGANGVCA